MILVDNTLVSKNVLNGTFTCQTDICKGACCVEGESGAPLTKSEIISIQKHYKHLKPFIRKTSKKVIKTRGFYYVDADKETVTTLVNNRECVFAIFEKNNVVRCAIEKAFSNKKIPFNKPISCNLYPIRITLIDGIETLEYHNWKICASACNSKSKPIIEFLQDGIIQKYGLCFYKNSLI